MRAGDLKVSKEVDQFIMRAAKVRADLFNTRVCLVFGPRRTTAVASTRQLLAFVLREKLTRVGDEVLFRQTRGPQGPPVGDPPLSYPALAALLGRDHTAFVAKNRHWEHVLRGKVAEALEILSQRDGAAPKTASGWQAPPVEAWPATIG